MTHPPAPWRLRGEVLVIPRGATSGLFLATYTGETLAYHELIVFRRGLVVSHIYVDDERSLAGGRAIWNLPKELAEFEVSRGRFVARRGGELLVDARIRRRDGVVPLPLLAPAIGELDGHRRFALGRGRMRAAPALVTLDGRFGRGTRLGLAGDRLDLIMPAP
jgi:Acetoacetate decarboxylase (ADC)